MAMGYWQMFIFEQVADGKSVFGFACRSFFQLT